MALALDILSWSLMVAGSLFLLVGALGLLRLPDVYSRTHASSITDTLGAGLVLAGLMVQAGPGLAALKLLLIYLFLLVTSPTSSHALAKSALSHGIQPLLGEKED
jgi:multicomponent Na+:H+ antiporter subunit G